MSGTTPWAGLIVLVTSLAILSGCTETHFAAATYDDRADLLSPAVPSPLIGQPQPVPRPLTKVRYKVDCALIADFEQLRPLIDLCADLGELEPLRNALEHASDLEHFRRGFEGQAILYFGGCPAAVSVVGVTRY